MRDIKSIEDIEKKRQRNQIIVGVILIATMLGSTLGFAFFSRNDTGNSDSLKYNGLKFIKNSQGFWEFEASGQKYITYYNPQETESIAIGFALSTNDFYGKPLYYFNGNQDAVYEIIQNLGIFASRYQEVCLEGEKCDKDLVSKTCSDNVIVFNNSQNLSILRNNKCIIINSQYDDERIAVDKIIFKALNIQQ